MNEKTSGPGRLASWAAVLALTAITVASFVNGLPFWMKRVGWLDLPPCDICERKMTHALERMRAEDSPHERQRLGEEAFYWHAFAYFRIAGMERSAKLAKDLAVLVLLVTCVLLGTRLGLELTRWDLLLGAFLAVVALALLYSITRYEWPVVVAGARAFTFLPVALLAYRFSGDVCLALVARLFVCLLVVQIPLAVLELSVPEQLFAGGAFGGEVPGRAVGTFVHPNALGIFAVCTLVLYACFGGNTMRSTTSVAAAAGLLVVLSGSGTAMLLLTAVIIWILGQRVENRRVQWTLYVGLISMVVVTLPWFTGRGDIFASLTGRLWVLGEFWASPMSIWEFMMGHGLGVGTNTLVNLARGGYVEFQETLFPPSVLGTVDSTPLSLVAQVGLLGLLLFFILCLRSARMDVRAGPVLLVLLAASTMINLLEFYPLNVVLGLLLARGVGGRKPLAGFDVRSVEGPPPAIKQCP